MMEQLRRKVGKILVTILFVLLILSFAVWGIGDIFRGQPIDNVVVEVGDQQIDQVEMSRRVNAAFRNLQQRFGNRLTMEDARQFGLREQVISQAVNGALFIEKAGDMGLVVTEEELLADIRNNPVFHGPGGRFDPNRFREVLFQINLPEQQYLQRLERDILRERILQAATGAVETPTQLARQLYVFQNEARTARIATVSVDDVGPVEPPSDTDLRTFYDENTGNYMAPEYRAVTLVRLSPDALAEEMQISEEELRSAYEERRDEFGTPERRHVRQIVFDSEDRASEAYELLQQGRTLDSVSEDLKGEDVADLGTVVRNDLPEDLAEVAFSLESGAVSEPVEGTFGWHILQVSEIESAVEPSFAEVRERLRDTVARNRAIDDIVSIANQLDDQLAGGAALEEAAAGLGLKLKKIPAIDRDGLNRQGDPVEGIPAAGEFVPTVFETPSGQQSLLQETQAGGFFVLRVDGVTPAEARPFDEVRDAVAKDWEAAQLRKLAEDRAIALQQKVSAGTDFEAAASEAGFAVRTTEPIGRFERNPAGTQSTELTGVLFEMSPGDVATASAPEGMVVAQLTEVVQADPAAAPTEVADLAQQINEALAEDLLNQYLGALRQQYEVRINTRALDNLLSQF